jgi:FKBP-type peptidyl-prolyl cis-trans isomerase
MIHFPSEFSGRHCTVGLTIAAICLVLPLCFHAFAAEPATSQATTTTHKLPDGLIITDIGESKSGAQVGDQVWVHYILKLADGTEIDNSYKRGEPIAVTLGSGQVIKGWEEGLIGMQVGGKRKLTIPPELGYGEKGQSSIPPNATLYFDTEMMGIKR